MEVELKNEDLIWNGDGKGKAELIRWQKTDATLAKIRALATQVRGGYEETDGYRNFTSGDEKDRSAQQLVLPTYYRKKVLEIARDMPMAGLWWPMSAKTKFDVFYHFCSRLYFHFISFMLLSDIVSNCFKNVSET